MYVLGHCWTAQHTSSRYLLGIFVAQCLLSKLSISSYIVVYIAKEASFPATHEKQCKANYNMNHYDTLVPAQERLSTEVNITKKQLTNTLPWSLLMSQAPRCLSGRCNYPRKLGQQRSLSSNGPCGVWSATCASRKEQIDFKTSAFEWMLPAAAVMQLLFSCQWWRTYNKAQNEWAQNLKWFG